MAMKMGDTYTCPNPECGCQIQVTRSARSEGGGTNNPRCCCGSEMQPETATTRRA
jgi:hypothetical protein